MPPRVRIVVSLPGDAGPATWRSDPETRTVVLVEGPSDRVALEVLARRQGRDLPAEGIAVVPMGGATNIGRYLDVTLRRVPAVRLAGLCDAAEEGAFRRGMERAGLGTELTRADMEGLGFHVCVADLEDELIRAVGVAGVEQVIGAHGDLRSWRVFQRQPAQQRRPAEAQLRRFLGTHSGRKAAYAGLLVEALDLERVPPPLERLLASV